jgi:hypothetical protein
VCARKRRLVAEGDPQPHVFAGGRGGRRLSASGLNRRTLYEHRLGRLAGHAWRISAKRADVGRWTCLMTSEAEAGPRGRCAGLRPVGSRESSGERHRPRQTNAAAAEHSARPSVPVRSAGSSRCWIAPGPTVSWMTSTLLLLCLQARESWLTGTDRFVGGAMVLHRRGREAAVVASVGVTPGVPERSCLCDWNGVQWLLLLGAGAVRRALRRPRAAVRNSSPLAACALLSTAGVNHDRRDWARWHGTGLTPHGAPATGGS